MDPTVSRVIAYSNCSNIVPVATDAIRKVSNAKINVDPNIVHPPAITPVPHTPSGTRHNLHQPSGARTGYSAGSAPALCVHHRMGQRAQPHRVSMFTSFACDDRVILRATPCTSRVTGCGGRGHIWRVDGLDNRSVAINALSFYARRHDRKRYGRHCGD